MHTLVDLFKTFQGRGEKTAMVYRTGVRRFVFSYRKLHEYSLKIAQWLADQGVQRGDRVLIWAPNSPWWQVAFWGTIARGAIVTPVDFMSGRERAERIAELTKAKLVIQSQYKLDKISNSQFSIFNIEGLEFVLEDSHPTQNIADSKHEDIAELIYTSGTTGDPKGVILTHRNVISNLIQINTHVPVVGENWNFLSVLPLSHVFEQIAGLLTPLYNGSSVVYLRTLKPSAIMEALELEDIYALPIVPRLLQVLKTSIERELQAKHLYGVFQWLMSILQPHQSSRGSVSDRGDLVQTRKTEIASQSLAVTEVLKRVCFYPIRKKFGKHFTLFISGAAALDAPTAEFWAGMGFRVLEGYGITECSPVLSANTFEKQIIGSVGKPLEGVEIKIEKKDTPPYSSPSKGEDMPPPYEGGVRGRFEIGEILAKGPNVFPGYYKNEEATKKAFTEDGWFKTGDMGYLDAEGNLYIKGRSKEMIVTGAGINVYPDDIEPVLNKIAGVKEACVVGIDKGAGEEVHAVLILAEAHTLSRQSSGHPFQEGTLKIPSDGGVDAKQTGWVEERAKDIIEQANAQLDSLQQITSFSLWPELEFPKTTTMKVQKFKVKEQVKRLERENVGMLQSQTDKLIEIISKVTGKPTNEISEQSVLVTDLGLTSIARLELVNYLEQEFRLDLEDTAITQTTAVTDLRKIIQKREKHHTRGRSRMWVHTPFGRALQYLMDNLLNWHIFRYFVNIKIEGLENLNTIKGPAIFIANHMSYIDGPCIFASLPSRWRYWLAAASREDLYFKPHQSFSKRVIGRLYFEFMTLLSGTILISQTGGSFRQSLSFMGSLADRGVSILFFPEGERSWDGKLLPFQSGLGIIVRELKIPVVPVKIIGADKILPRGSSKLHRGKVTVRYGAPIRFNNEQPSEIVARCRQGIEAL